MGKKIIFYIDSMQRGGAQRVMANLLTHFLDIGNDVVLVNDIIPNKDVPEYSIDNRVKRLFLKITCNNVVLKNLKRIFRLRQIIRKEKPDVVVSFLGPPNIRLILASIGLKCRVVVSVRNDPYYEYGSGLRRFFSNLVFLGADGIVFQTAEAQEYFISKIQSKSKIILNPVDEKFYSVNWNPLKKEIVVIGRLEKQKNPFLAIEAFLKIAANYSDYNLLFYGDGSLKDEMEKYIFQKKAQNRIFLCGRTSNVKEILSKACLYVMTSDFEGLPNALMEAMAVGLPCICTDCPCGGPRILINNNIDGILVKCGDKITLANAMERVLSSKKLQNDLGNNAKKKSFLFHPDIILEQWKNFLLK